MSFQYGGTVNQNKEDSSIHQKNLAKLCRICCNMVGKKYMEVKKYTDKIENKFYINVNIDNNAIHSEYMCQKYYLVMTSSTKQKTTIKLKPLMNGTHTALTAKLKMKLFQKWLIGTQ